MLKASDIILTTLRTWADRDLDRLALEASRHPDLPVREMVKQLKLRRRAASKFPDWAGTDILYTERALEQSSGQVAAKHKRQWLKGRVIDLSGGLGSDLIHNADQITHMVYCDIDPELCELFRHNASVLDIQPVAIHNGDGIDILSSFPDNYFDVVYVDPDRRAGKGRSVSLKDASPDITAHLTMMLAKAETLLVKASPALDPTEAARQLPGLTEYRVVSVDGEVKEVLLFVGRSLVEQPARVATVIRGETISEFRELSEKAGVWTGDQPAYIFEPDPAIIRAGLVSDIAAKHGLMHANYGSVYLLGSEPQETFPGRSYRIDTILPANFRTVKDWCKQQSITKANIARRDFPEDPDTIRKALKLKDGGDHYLFFTKWQGGFACFVCAKTHFEFPEVHSIYPIPDPRSLIPDH
jgi:hypothetical protein